MPRFLVDGSFAGYIAIAVDITEMKHNQEQLLATQKLESLGVTVSGIAHNFNNLVGQLSQKPTSPCRSFPRVHPRTGMLNNQCDRDASCRYRLRVDGVCEFRAGRSAHAARFFQCCRGDPSPGRGHCFQKYCILGEAYQKITRHRAEISQIRQVVMNVLTNACESLPNHQGSVSVNTSCVRITPEDATKDHVSLPAGEYVRLCVTDSGCGIPGETLGKIFDPFFTTKFPGRGLGLAAVQGIVRSLGGMIAVQSNPGQGSIFEVLFPCIAGPAPISDPEPTDR